jgi:hypothetical protein
VLEDVGQAILRQFHRDVLLDQIGQREKTGQRAFQHADVRRDLAGDELQHAVGDLDAGVALAHALGLVLQNAEAQLVIGGMDVHDEAALQARRDAVVQFLHVDRRAVAGDDDLLAHLHQRVEGVEEFLLRGGLAGDELHVIDHQHVDGPEHLLEADRVLFAQRADEAVHELLGRQIQDVGLGEVRLKLPRDGVHQVRLAQAHAAIEEERVERDIVAFGDAARGGMGQFVGLADDEGLEGEVAG